MTTGHPCRFEPKPGFEPGTPSLRVKCSTAELFRPTVGSRPTRSANIVKKSDLIKKHLLKLRKSAIF